MIFPDESGFSLVSPLKRTWARRGRTPVLRTSLEHTQRLNLIGAWCLTPAGQVKVHLLRQVPGAMVMVWDKHPIHKRNNASELPTNVRRGVARTRISQNRLWACLYAADLPWQRQHPKGGH